MTRAEVVALIRAELAECEPAAGHEDVLAEWSARVSPSHPSHALALVRIQFHAARAAAWRDHARRLRDLLTEMGEAP